MWGITYWWYEVASKKKGNKDIIVFFSSSLKRFNEKSDFILDVIGLRIQIKELASNNSRLVPFLTTTRNLVWLKLRSQTTSWTTSSFSRNPTTCIPAPGFSYCRGPISLTPSSAILECIKANFVEVFTMCYQPFNIKYICDSLIFHFPLSHKRFP